MNNLVLLWHFMKGFRLKYIGAIISIGIAALFSIITPLVISFTIDSIIGSNKMNLPKWIMVYIDDIGGRDFLIKNLWIFGLIIVILTLISGVFLFFKGKWSAVAAESIVQNIKNRLYDHIQNLSYDEHVKAKTGDLLQRCTSDVDTVRKFLAVQFVEIGRALFLVLFISIIIFSLDTQFALISVTSIPFVFMFAFVFFIKMKRIFKKREESEGRLTTVLQENLTGVRVVRAFAQQDYEISKFDKENNEFGRLGIKMMSLFSMYWCISDFICLLQIGTVLILGSYWAAVGKISIGTLIIFTTYEGMLIFPIREMGQILTDMGKAMVSIGRIQEILDIPQEDMDEYGVKPGIKGDIEFNNVCFGYDGEANMLKNVSFKVKRGQTISIMGPTGSGKTTLVNLLLRLYEYSDGSIKIDGIELNTINKEWIRKNIGMVAQEPFLYSKTIMDNIGLAKESVNETEVYVAAGIASVHDVILQFEKGYDTVVGERGVTLSGGQKQRVTIARTVINDYPILIFDDSLSAVDTETDAQIRKALKERSKDVTTFIISHRMTTLSESDVILVLEKGELVQAGTHEELINKPGLYSRVWNIQSEAENELEYQMA